MMPEDVALAFHIVVGTIKRTGLIGHIFCRHERLVQRLNAPYLTSFDDKSMIFVHLANNPYFGLSAAVIAGTVLASVTSRGART